MRNERVGLLVGLHEAVQGGAAQSGQGDAGGVAQQARLDDGLQGEGVIALRDQGGRRGGELLVSAAGQQVERGGVLGRGGRRGPARLAASNRCAGGRAVR